MLNKTLIMGRICNDLEVKTTPSGRNVLSFRIAVDRDYQPKGEEKKTDFFDVIAWQNNADFISRFFGKGRLIIIVGELQTRSYTDKNNVQRTVTEILVNNAYFTGEPKPQESGNPAPPAPKETLRQAASPTYTAEDFTVTATDDDFPF